MLLLQASAQQNQVSLQASRVPYGCICLLSQVTKDNLEAPRKPTEFQYFLISIFALKLACLMHQNRYTTLPSIHVVLLLSGYQPLISLPPEWICLICPHCHFSVIGSGNSSFVYGGPWHRHVGVGIMEPSKMSRDATAVRMKLHSGQMRLRAIGDNKKNGAKKRIFLHSYLHFWNCSLLDFFCDMDINRWIECQVKESNSRLS